MKYFLLALSLGILIFWGCSSYDKGNPISPPQGSGKIQLKIDKANAPVDVVTIDAILTRDGYEPITGTLNLLSDSTADILLDDIPAGIWHLKVDAKDDEEVILYTGETEVEIFAGFVTQVNLTLDPTGEGTGSIYIYVTWGTHINSNWIDFSGNPILAPSGSFYETHGVGQANILLIDGIYKMWYLGDAGGSNKYVMYAESNNGTSWARPFAPPVLSPGPSGAWDDLAVHPGAVMYDEGTYLMFYVGFSDPYGQWGIGLAESADGIDWVKRPNPVIMATSGWEYQIASSSVIKVGSTYYLYYYGRNLPSLHIGLATSQDKITWTKYAGNPIISPDTGWEGTGVYYPTVYEGGSGFEMIYMNASGTGFGKATSTDGINWEKNESNPFFTNNNTFNDWADYKIAYPFFLNVNNKDRIYYTGFNSGNNIYKIGFVTK